MEKIVQALASISSNSSHLRILSIWVNLLDEIWWYTGCPAKLFTLGYLLFCRLLVMQNAKVGTFFKNLGNLLHDRHKNFENGFRNIWDNWAQSWHLKQKQSVNSILRHPVYILLNIRSITYCYDLCDMPIHILSLPLGAVLKWRLRTERGTLSTPYIAWKRGRSECQIWVESGARFQHHI